MASTTYNSVLDCRQYWATVSEHAIYWYVLPLSVSFDIHKWNDQALCNQPKFITNVRQTGQANSRIQLRYMVPAHMVPAYRWYKGRYRVVHMWYNDIQVIYIYYIYIYISIIIVYICYTIAPWGWVLLCISRCLSLCLYTTWLGWVLSQGVYVSSYGLTTVLLLTIFIITKSTVNNNS